MTSDDWERRLSDAWASIERRDEPEFLALIQGLVAELPADSGVGLFERAAVFDSSGHPNLATTPVCSSRRSNAASR